MSDILLEQVEMVEKEFSNMDFEVLFNMVWDLILKNKKYFELEKNDRYDYLVDGVLITTGLI